MVEICNTPSDPHPSSNTSMDPINPSQNTGLLQAFFDDNENNEFNTLTNKGKYFHNITKKDIECVKLKDLYDTSNHDGTGMDTFLPGLALRETFFKCGSCSSLHCRDSSTLGMLAKVIYLPPADGTPADGTQSLCIYTRFYYKRLLSNS